MTNAIISSCSLAELNANLPTALRITHIQSATDLKILSVKLQITSSTKSKNMHNTIYSVYDFFFFNLKLVFFSDFAVLCMSAVHHPLNCLLLSCRAQFFPSACPSTLCHLFGRFPYLLCGKILCYLKQLQSMTAIFANVCVKLK